MSQLQTFQTYIVSYALNSLWQLPVLTAAGWLLSRLLRPAGPRAEHRLWVGILLLQTLLPASFLVSWEWLRSLQFWIRHGGPAANSQVTVALGPGTALGGLRFTEAIMVAIVV